MSNITSQNIRNQSDTYGKPIGLTINAVGNTAAYKFYSGSVDTGTTPVVLDVYTDLGRVGSSGYIQNFTSSVKFTVAMSIDGTTYGDEISVRDTAILNLDSWIGFKKIRLTRVGGNSDYEILVK
jgi:hypothetical protein